MDVVRSRRSYDELMSALSSKDILHALRLGPATPDALAARLGEVDREAMWWAVDEAVQLGLVASTAEIECGPDGLCGTSVPAVLSIK
jgi:hypothetical protein